MLLQMFFRLKKDKQRKWQEEKEKEKEFKWQE